MRNIVTKLPAWNPGARFLLLFNNPYMRQMGCNGTEIASKIFEMMYSKFNVARVVILYATGIQTYNVYVTNPYKDEKDCRKNTNLCIMHYVTILIVETLKPILIDVCDDGKLKHGELTKITIRGSKVPEKVPACTFTFCAKENEPYMNANCTSGLEIDILRILQNVMKFKVNINYYWKCHALCY